MTVSRSLISHLEWKQRVIAWSNIHENGGSTISAQLLDFLGRSQSISNSILQLLRRKKCQFRVNTEAIWLSP